MSIVQKLTPPAALVENAPPVAAPASQPLTVAEQALFSRAQTFVGNVLRAHGITPNSAEIYWLAAHVADFVLGETAPATPKEEKSKT